MRSAAPNLARRLHRRAGGVVHLQLAAGGHARECRCCSLHTNHMRWRVVCLRPVSGSVKIQQKVCSAMRARCTATGSWREPGQRRRAIAARASSSARSAQARRSAARCCGSSLGAELPVCGGRVWRVTHEICRAWWPAVGAPLERGPRPQRWQQLRPLVRECGQEVSRLDGLVHQLETTSPILRSFQQTRPRQP